LYLMVVRLGVLSSPMGTLHLMVRCALQSNGHVAPDG
jgi:hypothetical protein